jgi:hypothetical protein
MLFSQLQQQWQFKQVNLIASGTESDNIETLKFQFAL